MKRKKPVIDKSYQCVMSPPELIPMNLKTCTVEVPGTHVRLPSSLLFITQDGSVYVVEGRGKTKTYTSLKSLVKQINSALIIENFTA